MQTLAAPDIFLFAGFSLDRRRGGLFKRSDQGTESPVALGSRALDILSLLVERSGELVTKNAINTAVWRGALVEDSNLTVHIAALRRVLDKDRAQGTCIQTVVGRGYRFVKEVVRLNAEGSSDSPAIGDTTSPPMTEARRSAPQTPLPLCSGGPPAPAIITPSQGHHRLGHANAPHLSIVVLPFADFSDVPDQQHFADRVTDDLTTGLSRFTSMVVTSHTTAATYRNKPVDARQIGRELGVRYVLEGSVQRFRNHIRVNTRLIDAWTDAHLCAEQFDRDPADPFAVQDEIGKRIEVRIYHELLAWEGSRPTEHPDALDYILRGRAAQIPFDRDNYAEAIGFFNRALAVDPQSAEAQGWLADALARRVIDEMTDAAVADVSRSAGLAAQAVAASSRSACAHSAQGQVLSAQSRYAEAIPAFETAREINPAWPHVCGFLSDCKLWTGSVADAIPLVEQAIRISPRDAWRATWYSKIGRVHLVQSRTNEAIAWLEKARRANPQLPSVHAMLASAYALNDEIERAVAELAEARGLSRDGRYSSLPRLQRIGYFGVPEIRALFEATYFAGLRKAGMPEE
jgi:TolB-like protein/DNA-binding winged helix-turn-helix (wHTH) protein/thioredoxin-like negative regulator of GroEL